MYGPFAGVSAHGRQFLGHQAPIVPQRLDGVSARRQTGETRLSAPHAGLHNAAPGVAGDHASGANWQF